MGDENGLIKHLGRFGMPKPNQEKDKREIEKILKEEFNIEGEVLIFGYNLRHIGIEEMKYDNMVIGYKSESLKAVFDAHFNGRFDGYGINNVSAVGKNV